MGGGGSDDGVAALGAWGCGVGRVGSGGGRRAVRRWTGGVAAVIYRSENCYRSHITEKL